MGITTHTATNAAGEIDTHTLTPAQTEIWVAQQADHHANFHCAELLEFAAPGIDANHLAATFTACAREVAWLQRGITAQGEVFEDPTPLQAHIHREPREHLRPEWWNPRITSAGISGNAMAEDLWEFIIFTETSPEAAVNTSRDATSSATTPREAASGATTPATAVGCLFRLHHVLGDGFSIQAFLSWMCRRLSDPTFPCPFVSKEPAGDLTETDGAREWREFDTSAPIPSLRSAAHIEPGNELYTHTVTVPVDGRAGQLMGDPNQLAQCCSDFVAAMTGSPEATIGFALLNRHLGAAQSMTPRANILPWKPGMAVADLQRIASFRTPQVRRALGMSPTIPLFGPIVNVRPFPQRLHGPVDVTLTTLCTGPIDDVEFIIQRADLTTLSLTVMLYAAPQQSAQVESLLQRFARYVTEGELLTDAEDALVARQFNDTAAPIRAESISAQIEAVYTHEMKHPTEPALWWEGRWFTHEEKWRQVAQVQSWLRSQGVGAGDVVGIALPRSPWLLAAVAAAVSLGAAFCPFDPELPAARIEHMRRTARPTVVVDEAAIAQLRDGGAQGLVFAANAGRRVAYILFTSGSTGLPKGVGVSQIALVNRLQWMVEDLGLDAQTVVAQKTPASFDVSIWELVLAYTHGCRVAVMAPGAHKNPQLLAAALASAGVTLCHFVPSALRLFLEATGHRQSSDESAGLAPHNNESAILAPHDDELAGLTPRSDYWLPTLQTIVTSGEALSPGLVRATYAAQISASLQIVNLYGPTEAAIDVTCYHCRPDDAEIPIGAPVANTECYVLGPHHELLPPGVPGTLYLAGIQLAEGYVNDEEKTAQRFQTVAIPHHTTVRLYNTGDIAAWRADGQLLYLGRSDDQVKLRGQRLEIGEVEAQLQAILPPEVGCAVAIRRMAGEDHLVAFVDSPAPLDSAAIRRELATTLPAYMVPTFICSVPDLPYTTSGKLNRQQLPSAEDIMALVAAQRASSGGDGTAAHVAEHGSGSPSAAGTGLPIGTPGTATVLPASTPDTPLHTTANLPTGTREHHPGTDASPLYRQVQDIFTQILGYPIGVDDNFFASGGTSLSAVKLAAALTALGSVSVEQLFAQPTISATVAALQGFGTSQAAWEPVLPLRDAPGARRLTVCVHPAGGLSWIYQRIIGAFPGQAVALQSPGFTGTFPSSIEEAARVGLRLLAERSRLADYSEIVLVGWSVGGLIAQEMAALLETEQAADRTVRLWLLDAYPAELWASLPAPTERELERAAAAIAGAHPGEDYQGVFSTVTPQRRAQIGQATKHYAQLMRQHRTRQVQCPTVHIQATRNPDQMDPEAWAPFVPQLRIVPVDCDHPGLMAQDFHQLLFAPLG